MVLVSFGEHLTAEEIEKELFKRLRNNGREWHGDLTYLECEE